MLKRLLIAALVLIPVALSGCVIATVRTLDEDEEAKVGFNPVSYVDEIWESRVLPTYESDAQDFGTLITAINTDQNAAIERYGHRSGTGDYSFMVQGTGVITSLDTSSRAGLALVDIEPTDGTPDLSLTIGPLIKVSQRASVRDAVGFIVYGDFVNQQEFAGVANAMGDLIAQNIADQLGAENIDAIRDIDPASIQGKTVNFSGAFALDASGDIIVVPVIFEVAD